MPCRPPGPAPATETTGTVTASSAAGSRVATTDSIRGGDSDGDLPRRGAPQGADPGPGRKRQWLTGAATPPRPVGPSSRIGQSTYAHAAAPSDQGPARAIAGPGLSKSAGPLLGGGPRAFPTTYAVFPAGRKPPGPRSATRRSESLVA